MKTVIIAILALIFIIGCATQPIQESIITIEEAIAIAENSDCIEKGSLTEEYVYNENTKTWWINLDMKEEFKKEICNPACVVNEETKTAEINWRCTGVIPEKGEESKEDFCGISTEGLCSSDSDCITGGCSGQVCQSKNQEPVVTICDMKECYNAAKYGLECKCLNNKCQWS